MRRNRTITSVVGATVGMLVVSTGTATHSSATEAVDHVREAEVFKVIQEGMTEKEAARLAEQAGVGLALRPDGSFAFVDHKNFAKVPRKRVKRRSKRLGRDEEKRRTVAKAVDREALAEIQVPGEKAALKRATALLGEVDGFEVRPRVDHTTVEISGRRGKLKSSHQIDTTVTYDFRLGGLPVVGPGAKQRVAFDGADRVVQLSRATRQVASAGTVPIISPDEAMEQCTALYGRAVKQGEPTLAYYAPALSATKASGRGSIEMLLPHYVCAPSGEQPDREVRLTGRLVPAAPELTPVVHVSASRSGDSVAAAARVEGGAAPFDVQWSSSTTRLTKADGARVEYTRKARGRVEDPAETLTATVTDANGVVSTAVVTLARDAKQSASGVGGAGGSFAEVGIEQTVDEWQCAQDSANGFRDVMSANGQAVNFDWRGANAFEKDFKDTSFGGWDSLKKPKRYVDEVDAQWYTGHGWSGGFTFKGNVDDTSIVPGDARWGDRDLEWMQLESCQVLRDTNGSADYFARWDEVFRGLHLLNGFDTNAYCIGGGTGARFAEYLFPETFLWWQVRPALTVQQAWASMANDLEPAGVRWRTISPMKGSINNLADKYWGQGSVGPDISAAERTGFIAISGVA